MNFYRILRKLFKSYFYSLKFFLILKKNEPLLASLPRSGTHFTFGLINVCVSMKYGFQGKLAASDNLYASFAKIQIPFDERGIFQENKTPYFLWHSHLPYSKIIPRRKKYCKTIVLIREPVQAIKSYMLHILLDSKNKKNFIKSKISLNKFRALDKKYEFLSQYSEFLKTWRKRKIQTSNKQLVIFDNKVITKKVYNYIKFINVFFNFKFNEKQLRTAVNQLDIKKISKASTNKSIRITKNKLNFSKDVENYITNNCKKEYLNLLSLSDNKKLY